MEPFKGSPDSSVGKESACNAGEYLGQEDPLEKGQATHSSILGLPGGSAGNESACNAGDLGSILGWEDLEKGKATHSSILAWRIPWTVQSMGSQRVGHD